MIGIIGAMDVEVNAIKARVKGKTTASYAGVEFVCGFIEDVMVCVAECGIGKVNAAISTQAMIDNFNVDKIINIGCACSLSEDVSIKNVVIATDVCQHDIDITPLGDPKGFINGLNTVKVKTDPELSDRLARCAINSGERIHRGTIASGDIFIASKQKKDAIAADFGAICGEMEGGAIGHACAANGIPFAVLRSISDGGDEAAAQIDYPTFKKIAADISTAIIVDFLKSEQEQIKFS